MKLRDKIEKLAAEKPELRGALEPLLKSSSYESKLTKEVTPEDPEAQEDAFTMRTLLAFLLPALLCLTACKHPLASIRSPEVYENELDYNRMVQEQGTTHLRYWLSEHCTCDDDQDWVLKADQKWSEECEATADWILVVEIREPWHRAMALYNGSLLEEKPPESPPEIPSVSALCPGEDG